MSDHEHKSALLLQLRRIAEALERAHPAAPVAPDFQATPAFLWRQNNGVGHFHPVPRPALISLNDLHGIDAQKNSVLRNTEQFVRGLPANHVLLTGARGTGKSSLVKAMLHRFINDGLRLIEVEKDHLVDLPQIVTPLASSSLRFILFCDDLSFNDDEPGYKALKTILDGSVAAPGGNVLIYATSNRKHLLPEYHHENLATTHDNGEIRPADSVEEKVSLSERFGLWLSFYPFDQDEYLTAAQHWLQHYGLTLNDGLITQARAFAILRGSRSGRVARQFAIDMAGQAGLNKNGP